MEGRGDKEREERRTEETRKSSGQKDIEGRKGEERKRK